MKPETNFFDLASKLAIAIPEMSPLQVHQYLSRLDLWVLERIGLLTVVTHTDIATVNQLNTNVGALRKHCQLDNLVYLVALLFAVNPYVLLSDDTAKLLSRASTVQSAIENYGLAQLQKMFQSGMGIDSLSTLINNNVDVDIVMSVVNN